MVDFPVGPEPEHRVRKGGFRTKKEAEDWERTERPRLEAASRAGDLSAEQRRRAESQKKTLADIAASWLASAKGGHESGVPVESTTYDGYEGSVRLYILPQIGHTLVRDIDGPLVASFQRILVTTSSHAKTQRVMRHLRQMLNHAVRRGWMPANPASSVRMKADTRAGRSLPMPDHKQLVRLFEAIATLRSTATVDAARCRQERPHDPEAGIMFDGVARSWRSFGILMQTAIATGLRISELLALRWEDLVLEEKPRLEVAQRARQDGRIGKPKTAGSRRTVPLPMPLANDLRAWKADCPRGTLRLVFPSATGHVERYANLYSRRLLPAARAAGLTTAGGSLRFAFHGTRHYHASALIEAGMNVGEVADQLGHADPTLTMTTYSHLFPDAEEARRSAIDALSARVRGAIAASIETTKFGRAGTAVRESGTPTRRTPRAKRHFPPGRHKGGTTELKLLI